VIKTVVNDDGGLAAKDFQLTLAVNGGTPTPFPGAAGPAGTTFTLHNGDSYTVTEDLTHQPGGDLSPFYQVSYSADCTSSLVCDPTAGRHKTCTVTNNDIRQQTQRSIAFFLHGSGATANPPVLFLDGSAPTGSTAKSQDSTAINVAGGNAWKDVGSWAASPSLALGSLTALSDLHVWLGLQNSDDQGTNFDLKAEVFKNGALVASGLTRCTTGVTRNPSLAKEVTIAFGAFSAVNFNGTSDVLSLKLSTRIGTNPNDTKCAGHNNAVGLRVYFGATNRAAKFDSTFTTPVKGQRAPKREYVVGAGARPLALATAFWVRKRVMVWQVSTTTTDSIQVATPGRQPGGASRCSWELWASASSSRP
jgi:hypothetical protein